MYWYPADRRIRSQAAARRAAAITRWLRTGDGLSEPPDDHSLFVAMHTCAYQLQRLHRTGQASRSALRRWEDRWRTIREHLVTEHIGLVYSMQTRFRHGEHDRDELQSETMFALLRAIDRYNPWKGYRFSTYACNVIARALVNCCRRMAQARRIVCSAHQEWLDGDEAPATESTELYLERLRHTLQHNLGSLTEIESQVIARRYAPDRPHLATFREIAESIGLSKERVRQVQNRALNKLREAFSRDEVLK